MKCEERMADLQLEEVAAGGGKGIREQVRYYLQQSRRERRREYEERRREQHQFLEGDLDMPSAPSSQQDDLDPNAFQKQIHINDGTSVVPVTAEDDAYSTPTIEDYTPRSLPATDSDDFSISPIRYVSSSQADPDDIDSDNAFTKIQRVIQLSSGTDCNDVVKRVRSIRLKYNIPWTAAAEILFFRLIKSALKLHHSSEGEFKEHIEQMLINWKDTLKYFFPNRFSEVDALEELQNACLKAKMSFPVFPTILSCLYKHNIISQRTILYWAQDTGWEYGSNETFLKESSEFIKTLKQGLSDNGNKIKLYGSEEVFEGHGFDDEDCTSEVGMDISDLPVLNMQE